MYSPELAGLSLCHAVLIIRATLRHGSAVKPGINSLIVFSDRLVLAEPAKRSDAQNLFCASENDECRKRLCRFGRESNPLPLACESDALPAELTCSLKVSM